MASSRIGQAFRAGCGFLLLIIALHASGKEPEKPLVITNSKAWQPFSYINESGQPDGLLIDLWREYARVTGQKIEFRLVDWQHSLDLLHEGKADVHAGLLWSPERDKLFDYGLPLAQLDSQLFFSNELRGTDVHYYLLHETVGVVAGGYEEYYAKRYFPGTKLQTFDDNDTLLAAAFRGDIKAFIADLQVANFYIYTSADPTRFIPVRHLYTDQIRFAVKKGDLALLAKLEEGFARIKESDRERIIRKWMHVETVYPIHLGPWLLLAAGLIMVAYIVQLRRAVANRTAELSRANARLEKLASTDPLTGLLNRRAFIPSLEQQLTSGPPCALLLFDVDHFKETNDKFGHNVGDKLLEKLAESIAIILPEQSLFARIGGEEFCVLLPSDNLQATGLWAACLCQEANKERLETTLGEVTLSISTGAVWISAGESIDTDQLLRQADQLMYQAKANGRNTWQAAPYQATAYPINAQ
ncbi:sensor domain-containing diguanylate cyclase [Aeromonas jandaei]|uniref:transporter substrate-binding domain-containing diguanylate cyclase n=1 Tax=Aeromonas TaxID=642 RepID=UPI00090392BC|nr:MULTISPECIES: sensor domain-containing diguanylate cyclase [unclassified Aeromonas]QXC38947.1 sensor domain-containing diguanylate cyclase [Aeromonas sp. FDAARGOS 1410]